jgi:hypothetical protein
MTPDSNHHDRLRALFQGVLRELVDAGEDPTEVGAAMFRSAVEHIRALVGNERRAFEMLVIPLARALGAAEIRVAHFGEGTHAETLPEPEPEVRVLTGDIIRMYREPKN